MHRIIYCGTLLILLLFSGCSHHRQMNPNFFRYNESTGITTLDPAFAKNLAIMWPVHQIYNTLVELDLQMNIQPSLARDWSFSADLKTIRFELRQDVFFHDDPCFINGKGRKLVAQDVVYSFERIINKEIASPGAWIFNDKIQSEKSFVAVNDSVFELILRQPCSYILGILSMQYCSIIPHEAIEKYGSDFRRHPVGTGPFEMLAWDENQALLLKKNPLYFEKDQQGNRLPYLDGISVSFLESKLSEFLAFQQKQIDFINDIDPSFKDEILLHNGSLKDKWQNLIVLQKYPYLNTEYLGFLVDTSRNGFQSLPTQIKKIRQAINFAIDRKKIMLYLRNSIGSPAFSGFLPKGIPFFDSTLIGYEYNPTKALQLIKEAGFDENHPLPSIKLITVPTYANIGTSIVNELNQVGITISLEIVQKSILADQMANNQISFFRASWIADYPDPLNYFSVFYSKNPSPPNYTRFANADFDKYFDGAMGEPSKSLRAIYYRKMDSIIIEEAPIVPLWYDQVIHLVQKNIKGFIPTAMNMLELRRVQKQ